MQSTLFTELTAGEEANLSGGKKTTSCSPPSAPPCGCYSYQYGKGGDGYGGPGIVNNAPSKS
ncbi:MAG: hypothetical protein V7K88_18735 [Nostoc sp.]|uniref:hypothetical protein n=1 Tax=Nostoc sp. TaxID=1180 RepID=UPI002FFA0CF1